VGLTSLSRDRLLFVIRERVFVSAEMPSESSAPERAEVFRVIQDLLADILEVEASSIKEGDSFVEDLHLGSLELIELVEAIEEEFSQRSDGFRIEDEDLEDLKTVRDVVDYVLARV
jgi:acyl carrier protein